MSVPNEVWLVLDEDGVVDSTEMSAEMAHAYADRCNDDDVDEDGPGYTVHGPYVLRRK